MVSLWKSKKLSEAFNQQSESSVDSTKISDPLHLQIMNNITISTVSFEVKTIARHPASFKPGSRQGPDVMPQQLLSLVALYSADY